MAKETQMDLPKRIQLSRKKGARLPEDTIRVSRPSKWGNPYIVGVNATSKNDAVRLFEIYIKKNTRFLNEVKQFLPGKNLACWCAVGEPCHGDVLLKLANE